MPKYQVLVHGNGFAVRRLLLLRRHLGLFPTCYVDVETGAEALALALVRDDPKLILGSESGARR